MHTLMILAAAAAAAEVTCDTIGEFDECVDLVGGVAYTSWSEEGDHDHDEQLFIVCGAACEVTVTTLGDSYLVEDGLDGETGELSRRDAGLALLRVHGSYEDDYVDVSGITNAAGEAIIELNGGDDTLFASNPTVIRGGDGDDTIRATTAVEVHGGRGDDEIRIDAGDGTAAIYGGAGDDTLTGSRSGDFLMSGGDGNDFLYVRGRMTHASDVAGQVRGDDGKDVIYGSRGDDDLWGGPGMDRIVGGAGNDTIRGGGSSDTIIGGAGDDLVYAGPGDDTVRGRDGDDRLHGGKGDDLLVGSRGADILDGSGGENTVRGGPDEDACYITGDDPASGCELVESIPSGVAAN